MKELNRRAMVLPRKDLVKVLEDAIQEKKELLAQRDLAYGKDRIQVHSYGENLYLPESFQFDYRDYLNDSELAIDIDLRSRLFWLDNSHDDDLTSLGIGPFYPYFEMSVFGVDINMSKDAVPNMHPHRLSEKMDLSLIEPFDFEKNGVMPLVLKRIEEYKRLSEEQYDGKLPVGGIPWFYKGVLDVYVQLRGYENFVEDTYDNPEFIHEAMECIVERRVAFNKCVEQYMSYQMTETRIEDDWLNFPFITPAIYEEFAVPYYKKIAEKEAPVTTFHTCGVLEPVASDLVKVFPKMHTIDLSGWNDVVKVDRMVPKSKKFRINFKNTFVLIGNEEDQRQRLESIREIAQTREVEIVAQAIVRLHPTLDESIDRMNRFIDMAHEIFYR